MRLMRPPPIRLGYITGTRDWLLFQEPQSGCKVPSYLTPFGRSGLCPTIVYNFRYCPECRSCSCEPSGLWPPLTPTFFTQKCKRESWSEMKDSNLRSSAPKADGLTRLSQSPNNSYYALKLCCCQALGAQSWCS